MKLAQLFEADYEKDYANGMPERGILGICNHVARQVGIHPNNVNFLGPGMGTKLPGWIELTRPDAEDRADWDLLLRLAPAAIKKAFKAHVGLDVNVAQNAKPDLEIVTFDVEVA